MKRGTIETVVRRTLVGSMLALGLAGCGGEDPQIAPEPSYFQQIEEGGAFQAGTLTDFQGRNTNDHWLKCVGDYVSLATQSDQGPAAYVQLCFSTDNESVAGHFAYHGAVPEFFFAIPRHHRNIQLHHILGGVEVQFFPSPGQGSESTRCPFSLSGDKMYLTDGASALCAEHAMYRLPTIGTGSQPR